MAHDRSVPVHDRDDDDSGADDSGTVPTPEERADVEAENAPDRSYESLPGARLVRSGGIPWLQCKRCGSINASEDDGCFKCGADFREPIKREPPKFRRHKRPRRRSR